MVSKVTKSSVGALFVVALLTTGCSDPKGYDIGKLTDEQRKEIGQKLTADEGQKLAAWMMRHAFSGKELPAGTTIRQALTEQDEWASKQKEDQAKAADLKRKVDAERKAKQEEFAKIVSAALISKRNVDGEYARKYVNVELAFENKGEKDIRGVKGILRVNDIFGDRIQNVEFSYDKGIAAKKTALYKGGIDINQFIDRDMKLWNTDFDKLQTVFEVSMVVFNDGTIVKAPE